AGRRSGAPGLEFGRQGSWPSSGRNRREIREPADGWRDARGRGHVSARSPADPAPGAHRCLDKYGSRTRLGLSARRRRGRCDRVDPADARSFRNVWRPLAKTCAAAGPTRCRNVEGAGEVTENPTQAEREVQRARADLSETLEALKGKLSFGELFEEVSGRFMAGDAGEFVRNLARQARENPMPAVLAGASLLWMMLGKQRDHRPAHEHQPPPGHHPTYAMGNGSGMRTAMESAQETGEGVLERARSAVSSARSTVRSVAETVGEVAETVGHTVGQTVSSAKEAAHSAG